MKIKKIGILTCSNMTQVLDCPVGGCLRDLNKRTGAFDSYKSDEVELIGTISCNGCPTRSGASVILTRIAGLRYYGMTHLHLSYCMIILCPFVNKYAKAIKTEYPELEVILGTHEPHQADEGFRSQTKRLLSERRKALIP